MSQRTFGVCVSVWIVLTITHNVFLKARINSLGLKQGVLPPLTPLITLVFRAPEQWLKKGGQN